MASDFSRINLGILPVRRPRDSDGQQSGDLHHNEPWVRWSHRAAGVSEGAVPARGVHPAGSGDDLSDLAVFRWVFDG